MTPLATALADGVVVLDGGLSTELEAAGHDVSSSLWSARLLRDDPAAVRAAHERFFAAGAQVATTASYQASVAGFAAAGIERGEQLIARSVELAQEARERAGRHGQAWVAASVGPYGAVLADGSEYTGDYAETMGVADLQRFHRPRLALLAAAGPDVLACETLPAAAEVEALLLELEALQLPAWLSVSAVVDDAGVVRTRRGERLHDVLAMTSGLEHVVAVGINCVEPATARAAVPIAAAASGKPVVVYPNSGERWDAATRTWTGSGTSTWASAEDWVRDGARLVGGCCRVGPDAIAGLTPLSRSASG